MADQPRKHHYCPSSYLSFFTNEKNSDGSLFVFDKKIVSSRKGKPRNEAHQRDFYRLDVKEGEDPFFLEQEFSKIEYGAKKAIDIILSTKRLPTDDEDFTFLINFIGLMTVRGPQHRKRVEDFQSRVTKMIMRQITATKDRWQSQIKKLQQTGTEIPEGVSYESMKDFVDNERFIIKHNQTPLIQTMLSTAGSLIDVLAHRKWTVVQATEGSHFVCSDNPVGLSWTKDMGGFFSPGFGLPNTLVTFPLSSEFGLMGLFEDHLPDFMTLDAKQIATFNIHAISRADRFVYSPAEDFSWKKADETVGQKADLISMLNNKKSN